MVRSKRKTFPVKHSLPADVDFSSVIILKTNGIECVDFTHFLDGVCNLCVSFRVAVRAFSLTCPADYCFIAIHCIYCHFWRINVNVNVNLTAPLTEDSYS